MASGPRPGCPPLRCAALSLPPASEQPAGRGDLDAARGQACGLQQGASARGPFLQEGSEMLRQELREAPDHLLESRCRWLRSWEGGEVGWAPGNVGWRMAVLEVSQGGGGWAPGLLCGATFEPPSSPSSKPTFPRRLLVQASGPHCSFLGKTPVSSCLCLSSQDREASPHLWAGASPLGLYDAPCRLAAES